jgi:hypothetical protein
LAARLRRLISACAQYGIAVEKPGSGSHWKAKKSGCRTYPIPAPNGEKTEISDQYIRGSSRNFEIDLEEFVSKL